MKKIKSLREKNPLLFGFLQENTQFYQKTGAILYIQLPAPIFMLNGLSVFPILQIFNGYNLTALFTFLFPFSQMFLLAPFTATTVSFIPLLGASGFLIFSHACILGSFLDNAATMKNSVTLLCCAHSAPFVN